MTTEPKPRRVGRLALTLGALTLAGSTALLTWWNTTLTGLPDVGDPFDVRAFTRPIPDDTNAYVLYKQAVALLPKEPEKLAVDWGTATESDRAWLDRSGKALEVWKRGTERPDALQVDPGTATFETLLAASQSLRTFCRAALLQGSRLEREGDYEGALDWYLALLRCSRHCGRRAGFIERLIGIAIHEQFCRRLTIWATEPQVDIKLLRRALDALNESIAATSPPSDLLKAEYLICLHSIADPALMVKLHDYEVVPNEQGGSTTVYGQHAWMSGLTRVRRKAMNEPERSRRVVRLILANWLAYCDLPPSRQPPRALPGLTITGSTTPAKILLGGLYLVRDDAPASARALPAEKIARWYASTVDAVEIGLPSFTNVEKSLARERSSQGALLVALANELYQREHGRYPEHVEELVGPYLKALHGSYKIPK